MRGPDVQQDALFSTVIPEERVPKDHLLRRIRQMVNEAPAKLDFQFVLAFAAFKLVRMANLGGCRVEACRSWGLVPANPGRVRKSAFGQLLTPKNVTTSHHSGLLSGSDVTIPTAC